MPVLPALSALRLILPSLVGPPLATYAALRVLVFRLPLFVALPLCFLSLPIYFFATIALRRFWNAREAARNGARLLPWIEDPSPLGTNVVRAFVANFDQGYLGDHLFGWASKYGWTYQMNIMGEDVVHTGEPEYIKAILATHFNSYKKPTESAFLTDMLGNGVFNADGDLWKFHRGITRPFFSRDRISDFAMFDRHTLEALGALRERLASGAPIDFQDLVSRFTIDSATVFLFGTNVRSLRAGLPYPASTAYPIARRGNDPADAFATAFLAAQVHCARRARLGRSWPLLELFDKSHARNLRTIRSFVEPLIDAAVARAETTGTAVSEAKEVLEGETMLDYMVKSTRDPVLLYDEALNILLAGRDTTASLLTSTVYALSQNPAVLAKLRAEILSVVGRDRAPTPDHLRQMRFLRAVLNEVLRLWTPVPFNSRQTIEPVIWPAKDGQVPYYIPANTRLLYSVLVMHRRTDLWGPDALTFDPERFLDDRVRYLTANNFIFLPFNAGPRICLGQQFAYNEASVFLVRLLQQYSGVQLAPDVQPPESRSRWPGREKVWMKAHLTMYAAGGLWVHFTPAADEDAA
ncbi:cytochrome P450 [Vararia minispora EC-137]|uniref:Cytochrome P450 n=1 Tax=Vararia minispora EC-137 TaxID=1314806 RepID=A0ACB8QDL6_9AGAM|nr:cytochrome P450 [Vararia minispora EC-137]